MAAPTYTTYHVRKAAVLLAVGIAPLAITPDGRGGGVAFTFDASDGAVQDVLRLHTGRKLSLITEQLYDGLDRAIALANAARRGER